MGINYKTLYILITLFCVCNNMQAQEIISVNGVIKDKETKEAIPFVNIFIKNKNIGTTSNFEGKFQLDVTYNPKDSLGFAFVGYEDYFISLKKIKRQKKRKIKIWMNPQVTKLEEIIIKPKANPAHPILKSIVKNKKKNDPNKNTNIEYDKYSKNLIIIKDLNKDFAKKKIFKNYSNLFIKQKNGKLSIPVYFSEKLTSNISQKDPTLEKQQILSEKVKNISFLDIDDVKGYKEELTNQTNIYDNQLNIFGRSFISPIASTGLLYYKYYLIDSIKTANKTIYKIDFKPKNKKDLVFEGYFLVDNKRWAIQEISAEISSTANINFLNHLKLKYNYIPIDNTSTYYKERMIDAEFAYNKFSDTTKKPAIVLFKEHSSFGSINHIQKPIEVDSFTWEKYNKTKNYTNSPAIEISELTNLESKSNNVIDSLNNTWFVKATDKTYNTLLSGYYDFGKFGIGPYLEMVKRNRLEGVRLNLGIRTNEKMSKNYMLYGSLGYGIKDKEFKYSGSILYKFKNKKRKTLSITCKDDIVRLSENGSIFKIKENMLTSAKDNIIAAIAKRNSNESLFREKQYKITYSNEWNKNFTTNITAINRQLSSTIYGPLKHDNTHDKLSVNELRFDNRLSFHEKIMDKYVRRYYLGTNHPIIHIGCDLGNYNFNNKTGNYLRLSSTIKHTTNIGLTRLKYVAEMGHMFGTVPFPLLEVHRSNQTKGLSRFSFNLMENCEYINSSYISFMPELHLNGLIFNKIPIINTLNIREVISAKAAWGHLNKKHIALMDLPNNSSGITNPYCELGFGVENIFKYLRIEAIWRLTNTNKPQVHKFGIFFSVYISF